MIAALLLAAVAAAAPAPKPPQVVTFPTRDGWTIVADYRPPKPGGVVVVLAHGVGSSRGEWTTLAQRLADAGVGTLCVDLRGHHDSKKGPKGSGDFRTFDAKREWAKAVEDLDAAGRWLNARDVPPGRVAYGGASIGANLAALAARRDLKAPFLLLLSPGPDYRGVALRTRNGLRTLAGAAVNDPYAHETLGPLSTIRGVETFEVAFGHGVQMLDDASTRDRVVAWIVEASRTAEERSGAAKK